LSLAPIWQIGSCVAAARHRSRCSRTSGRTVLCSGVLVHDPDVADVGCPGAVDRGGRWAGAGGAACSEPRARGHEAGR